MSLGARRFMSNLSIAIVGHSLFLPTAGGVERVSDSLARALKARGMSVYYYNITNAKERFDFPVPQFSVPGGDWHSLESIADYRRFLREKKVDIVLNQDGLFETAAFFLDTGSLHVRKISVIHSVPFFNFQRLWNQCLILKNNSLKEYCKRVARIILYPVTKYRMWRGWKQHYRMLAERGSELCVLSGRYEDDVGILDLSFKRIHAIANPNTYQEPIEVDWDRKRREVLFVGRLDNRSKQVFLLLRIWKRVSKLCREWSLVIVGAGPDGDSLRKMAQQMGLERIRFEGRQDPESYYRSASILCMTSLYEGFPMVLTEAQQHGVTCVAYDSFSAIRDVIDDGETGILVQPFSVNRFAERLQQLMMDDELRLRIAHAARESVQRFSDENIMNRWNDYLQNQNE